MVFPISSYHIFSTDSASSARSLSERPNPSAHQEEAQEAGHRKLPHPILQPRGQSCFRPTSRRPIYCQPLAARTGRRSQTGSGPGAPEPSRATSPWPPLPPKTCRGCRGWWPGGTKPALSALAARRGDLIVFPGSQQQFAGSEACVII